MATPFSSEEQKTLSDWIDTILIAHKDGEITNDQARGDLVEAITLARSDAPAFLALVGQNPLDKLPQFNA